MKGWLEFTLWDEWGTETQARMTEIFHGENLLQIILHAHILMEQGLTARIKEKLAEPDVFKPGDWNFHKKAILYMALYAPPDGARLGFNKLRNKIAHSFQDDIEASVTQCLPFETVYPPWAIGAAGRPDAYRQVTTMAVNLLFELGVVRGVRRTDI
jgi:hypothetical protein